MSELFKKYSVIHITDGDYTQHYFNGKEIIGTRTCQGEIDDVADAVFIICKDIEANEIKKLKELNA